MPSISTTLILWNQWYTIYSIFLSTREGYSSCTIYSQLTKVSPFSVSDNSLNSKFFISCPILTRIVFLVPSFSRLYIRAFRISLSSLILIIRSLALYQKQESKDWSQSSLIVWVAFLIYFTAILCVLSFIFIYFRKSYSSFFLLYSSQRFSSFSFFFISSSDFYFNQKYLERVVPSNFPPAKSSRFKKVGSLGFKFEHFLMMSKSSLILFSKSSSLVYLRQKSSSSSALNIIWVDFSVQQASLSSRLNLSYLIISSISQFSDMSEYTEGNFSVTISLMNTSKNYTSLNKTGNSLVSNFLITAILRGLCCSFMSFSSLLFPWMNYFLSYRILRSDLLSSFFLIWSLWKSWQLKNLCLELASRQADPNLQLILSLETTFLYVDLEISEMTYFSYCMVFLRFLVSASSLSICQS